MKDIRETLAKANPQIQIEELKKENSELKVENKEMRDRYHIYDEAFKRQRDLLSAAQMKLNSLNQKLNSKRKENGLFIEAMKTFVERVEKGEIRSKATYKQFKGLLLRKLRG